MSFDPQNVKMQVCLSIYDLLLDPMDLRVNFDRYPNFKVYDLKTFEQVHVIPTQGGSVYSLAVSREYIICGTYENTIHVSQLVCVYDMYALLAAFSEINVVIISN